MVGGVLSVCEVFWDEWRDFKEGKLVRMVEMRCELL